MNSLVLLALNIWSFLNPASSAKMLVKACLVQLILQVPSAEDWLTVLQLNGSCQLGEGFVRAVRAL